MTSRTVNGQSYTLGYDAENRMTSISGALSASFVYNGNGVRVMCIEDGTTTFYIGNYFEWKGSTSTMVKFITPGQSGLPCTAGQSWSSYSQLVSSSPSVIMMRQR